MKKAIIVGATSGIGRALAQLLADRDYTVGITGRRRYLLDELKTDRPDHFLVCDFDITNTSIVADKLTELTRELGQLDLLILSSGNGNMNDDLDYEIEKETIALNVLGFTAVVDWATNYFKNQKQGHLVAITSIAGLRGGRQAPAYNASKAYQINYLEGMRQYVTKGKLPIQVTDVRPGFIDTKMAKGHKRFWIAPLEKAAKQIMRGIEGKRSVVYVTRRWRMIAILMRIFPRALYKKI